MQSVIQKLDLKYLKPKVADVRSGDTVKVHQKVKEGSKERVQVFEGLVIRTQRRGSLHFTITVRRIASGIGVEKTFVMHSPSVVKVEVVKRSKVRRNYLSYMRARTGKSARLAGVDYDYDAVNDVSVPEEKTTEVVEEVEEKPVKSNKSVETEETKEEQADQKTKRT
ncbi:50S ribosomal protein L19 [Candidatus Saccharibacteria bacterium CPR2]|nr:50S ribosomal protein L19 [Candidatus Saccharibacteria bacterium CPR2]